MQVNARAHSSGDAIVSSLLSALLFVVGVLWAGTSNPTNSLFIPLAMAVGFGGGRYVLALWNHLRYRRTL